MEERAEDGNDRGSVHSAEIERAILSRLPAGEAVMKDQNQEKGLPRPAQTLRTLS